MEGSNLQFIIYLFIYLFVRVGLSDIASLGKSCKNLNYIFQAKLHNLIHKKHLKIKIIFCKFLAHLNLWIIETLKISKVT